VATVTTTNENEAMMAPMAVSAFGRNLALVAVKIFSHVI
jgi:hypothetical protein